MANTVTSLWGAPPLRDTRETDDGRAVICRVDLTVLVVDGERLTRLMTNLSIFCVVGFDLSNGLVLGSWVRIVVDTVRGRGLAEITVLLSVDTTLLDITVEARGVLPLFAPWERYIVELRGSSHPGYYNYDYMCSLNHLSEYQAVLPSVVCTTE